MLGGQITAEKRRKIYLNIKEGAVVKRTPEGEERYAFVEGRLESINTKERIFRNETVVYWYLDLRDENNGDLYSIGFPYASNTFKSIILQLASERGLEGVFGCIPIKIEPYTKNGYDKVQVWINGSKLDWVTKQLPPVEVATIGGRTVKDDTKRMEFICSLAEKVKSSIQRSENKTNW